MKNQIRIYCKYCNARFFSSTNNKTINCIVCNKNLLSLNKQNTDNKIILDLEMDNED